TDCQHRAIGIFMCKGKIDEVAGDGRLNGRNSQLCPRAIQMICRQQAPGFKPFQRLGHHFLRFDMITDAANAAQLRVSSVYWRASSGLADELSDAIRAPAL